MNDMFDQGFREAEQHAQETSNGLALPAIELHFGGETPGHAIEGLAEWAAANDEQDAPFLIRAMRLQENHGSVPAFNVIITVSEFR